MQTAGYVSWDSAAHGGPVLFLYLSEQDAKYGIVENAVLLQAPDSLLRGHPPRGYVTIDGLFDEGFSAPTANTGAIVAVTRIGWLEAKFR